MSPKATSKSNTQPIDKKTIKTAAEQAGQASSMMVSKTGKSPTDIYENLLKDFGDNIVLQGVKTHNLKNIDITLPKNKLITITGVSGSGKSSLAFHTIYKEGQFRYIESLSSYLRQFFNLGSRPDIEHTSGLSPAIAIEQNKNMGNSRSTVGTLTEIDDYLRLLYAKTGSAYDYVSGEKITIQTIDQIIDNIFHQYRDQKVYMLQQILTINTPKDLETRVKKNRKRVDEAKSTGFTRFLLHYQAVTKAGDSSAESTEYFYLETPNLPDNYFPVQVYGIYDRITIDETKRDRLKEDCIKILQETKKFGLQPMEAPVGEDSTGITRYTDKMYCAQSDVEYPDFTPQHFSPNRQEGACPTCHGIGEILQVDFDKILDPQSLYADAILPRRDSNYGQSILERLAGKYGIDTQTRRRDLPDRFREVVINGDKENLRVQSAGKYITIAYEGVEEILKDQYAKGLLTVDFQAMLDMRPCPTCNGTRLRIESNNVYLEYQSAAEVAASVGQTNIETIKATRYSISELQNMPIKELFEFLSCYCDQSDKPRALLDRIMKPLLDRGNMIRELGLGYLTLSRQVGTLSGGEVQRLRLAKQLGNKLTGIIYVLDEPTIGLDEAEILRTIKSIKTLKDMGNTIIVVEHHDEFIKASDRVVEIGPGAGDFGGHVVFNGSIEDFKKAETLTADYVRGRKHINVEREHEPSDHTIRIKKANKFNLKNIDVNLKLGSFTIITGPSGAGKTTLMYSTLFSFFNDKEKFIQSFIRLSLLKQGFSRQDIIAAPVMQKEQYSHYENLATQEFYKHIGVESIQGYDRVTNVMYVDQSSIGKTPRSCPSTFIGVFDHIRNLFAGTPDAKYIGFNSGHFSFNSSKGACPDCKGYGYKKIELQFLPDTFVECETCHGRRYKPEILDIKRRGYTITQILDMYISDALVLFEEISRIHDELELLCEIGLGYLRMGQPAHTLSGGESQRLKLVKHLLKQYKGHTLYFLDEPTVGLHPDDINKLLLVLKKFLDNGDTVLMIEHDEDLLKFADEVVRLEDGRLVNN